MVRRSVVQILVLCLLLSSFRAPVVLAGALVLLKDKLGRTVKVKIPVKRAVFVVGYELIPSLNIWNQVVGISRWAPQFCDLYKYFVKLHPEYEKPTVGTGVDVNVESLFKLRPDLIITWTYNVKVVKFLSELGFKVYTIYPDSIKELFKLIVTLGKIFGKEKRAKEVVKHTKKLLNFVKLRISKIPKSKRKVAIYVGMKPTLVGCRVGISNELLRIAGGINPFSNINRREAQVSIEDIYRVNPDVIFIWGFARYGPKYFYTHPEWRYIKAVKKHEIYKLPEWSTWSPRAGLIALYMAKKMYPKVFRDIDFKKVADDFYLKVFGIHFFNFCSVH